MSQILEKAQELGNMLAQSDELKHYKAMEAVFTGDAEAQRAYSEYQRRREDISERMRSTEMSPEALRDFQSELQDCMAELASNRVVNDYLEAKSAFNKLITQVNGILSYCVKGEDESGCGGNCSACAGCH